MNVGERNQRCEVQKKSLANGGNLRVLTTYDNPVPSPVQEGVTTIGLSPSTLSIDTIVEAPTNLH